LIFLIFDFLSHGKKMEGLEVMLQQCGKGDLNHVVRGLCDMFQSKFLDKYNVEDEDGNTVHVKCADVEIVIHQELDREQEQDLSALAVVAGARPGDSCGLRGRRSAFRLAEAACSYRARTGLLKLGSDVLEIVADFLSFGMRLQRSWSSGGVICACHFPPSDGQSLLSCSGNGTLTLWDVASGEKQHRVTHARGSVIRDCCFAPDGKTIVSASSDKTLQIWDAESLVLQKTLIGHADGVLCCDIAPGGATILSGSHDQTLMLWSTATGDLQHTVEVGNKIWTCCFSPTGSQFLAGLNNSTLELFDIQSRQVERVFSGHAGVVRSCSFCPDGKTILSGSSDHTMKVWSATTGQALQTLTGHVGPIYDCTFSPDGQMVLSCSGDTTTRLWKVATGQLHRILDEHSAEGDCCNFAPDGGAIVACYDDGMIKLWT
jgi:WD40 repeat protein